LALQTEGVREQGAEENIKREELTGGWRELRNGGGRNFIICTPSSAVRVMNKGGRAGWGVGHTRKRSEIYTEVVLENQKGRDSLDDLDVDGSIILEWILTK